MKDAVNVDIIPYEDKVLVHNFTVFPYPFKDNEFDEIYAYAVLEHLPDLNNVFRELHRILKPNGVLIGTVPFYNSEPAVKDLQHINRFSRETLKCFDKINGLHYYHDIDFKIVYLKLHPTILGRLIPFKKYLNFFAITFGNIVDDIKFKMKVIK